MPWTATSVADTVGALMPEPVIVIDESSTSGLAQAGAGTPGHDWLTATGGAISDGIPAVGVAIAAPNPPALCPQPDSSPMDTMSGLCTPARENLDVTTVTDNNGADDIVRIERQRVGAGSARGPMAPDLLDLVPHRVSSNSPRVWESPHVASTPPTSSPTPAAAPSSNPDPHLNRRDGALSAALTITGPSTGPLGDTRVRGHGPRPHKVGEHPHPLAGRALPPACRG